MIVFINKHKLSNSEVAFLHTLRVTDSIVLSGNGVLLTLNIEQFEFSPSVFALSQDLESRGITFSSTLTPVELFELQQHHQQWITM